MINISKAKDCEANHAAQKAERVLFAVSCMYIYFFPLFIFINQLHNTITLPYAKLQYITLKHTTWHFHILLTIIKKEKKRKGNYSASNLHLH